MLLIIPVMEIKNGVCLNHISSSGEMQNFYHEISDNPTRLCQLWRRENAKSLHLIDRDSFTGKAENRNLIHNLAQSVEIPISLCSNVQNYEQAKNYLESGIYRVFLRHQPFTETGLVRDLISDFTASRLCFEFRSNDGFEFIPGHGNISLNDFAKKVSKMGGNRIAVSFTSEPESINENLMEEIEEVLKKHKVRATLIAQANSARDLWLLNSRRPMLIDSLVLGKSLYDNTFPCQKIWRKIESSLEPKFNT